MAYGKKRTATFYEKEILKYIPKDGVAFRDAVVDSTAIQADVSSGRYVLEKGTVMIKAGGVDEQQTLTSTATGGTFTLTYSGQTTGNIAYNATAAQIQTALVALSNIGDGDVVCSGGPLNTTPVVVTFQGALGHLNVSALTVDGTNLTGGAASVATTRAGAGPGTQKVRPAPASGAYASEIVGIAKNTLEFFYPPEAGVTDEPLALYFEGVIFDAAALVNYSGNAAAVKQALPTCLFE